MRRIDSIVAELSSIDDWEDKYGRLIDIGRQMPPLDPAERIEANLVSGCASKVWLVISVMDGKLQVRGQSDALIMQGMIAVLAAAYDGLAPADARALNAGTLLDDMGLQGHLSPQRANGLSKMISTIRCSS